MKHKLSPALTIAALLLVFLLLSALMILAANTDINSFRGNVTIGGAYAKGGTVIDAFIGGASSPATGGRYVIGSSNTDPHNFTLDFECTAGSTAFLKVWGINATTYACSNQNVNYSNLSVSLTANDGSCSYSNGCSSGICCSGTTQVNSSTSSGACQAAGCGAGITIPAFSLSAATITTSETVNFTINISSVLRHNITSANFTLVTGSTVVSRNFTIPSSGKDFNLSYKIFASSETASAGTYNVTSVQVNDNGSIRNLTAITNMNFTVTAVAAKAADQGGGSSSGGGGGGGATPAPTPAPEPASDTVETVKESLPAAFQEAAAAGNVEYKTVAAPEAKVVPVGAEAAVSAIEYAVDYLAKTEVAQQELNTIQEAVSAGTASTVQAAGGSVSKTIEVVTATNKITKEEVTVSVVKLSVEAKTADLKNVEVVEVIPKAAASNVNQVTFTGEKPAVLEADPVVKWFFAQVAKGQKKDLSYAINKDIRNIGTSTVAVQGRAEAAPAAVPAPPEAPAPEAGEKPGEAKKPTPLNTVVLVVIVAVVAIGGWLFLKGRKAAKGQK